MSLWLGRPLRLSSRLSEILRGHLPAFGPPVRLVAVHAAEESAVPIALQRLFEF